MDFSHATLVRCLLPPRIAPPVSQEGGVLETDIPRDPPSRTRPSIFTSESLKCLQISHIMTIALPPQGRQSRLPQHQSWQKQTEHCLHSPAFLPPTHPLTSSQRQSCPCQSAWTLSITAVFQNPKSHNVSTLPKLDATCLEGLISKLHDGLKLPPPPGQRAPLPVTFLSFPWAPKYRWQR